jgi:hypothetical protein
VDPAAPVYCLHCQWQGRVMDCDLIAAGLAKCPKCGYPVATNLNEGFMPETDTSEGE